MRILHISDIQAGKFNIKEDIKKNEKDKVPDEVYKLIINDLRYIFKKIHSQQPIDIIVISGDIASEGIEEDYIEVNKTLFKMMEDVFMSGNNPIPKNRWLIAPGNHDVQWGLNEKRFNEFIKFCHSNGFHSNFELENPASIFDLIQFKDEISEKKIEIIVLNSCLDIYNKETGKNANLSKKYFYLFADLINTPIIKILLCHHRLIEITNYNHNHCLEELRENKVILALVGDFHKSQKRVDEINGIKFITAGSLLAKTSERVSGFDIMNREFNVYDIDLEKGSVTYTTFIKTQNWEEQKREEVDLPFGIKILTTQDDRDNIIVKLKKIEDIIHKNHPTEDIIIKYMDSSFYTYMREREWKKASNQINFKMENEIEIITQIEYRIIKLRSFLSFVEKLEPQLNIKVPLIIDDYNISVLNLAVEMRRELPTWRKSLIDKIKEHIEDLNFISVNLTSLLSDEGILLFLSEDQKEEVISLTIQVEHYKEENTRAYLEIDIEEDRQFGTVELEKALTDLHNNINSEDLDLIYNFLNDIQNDLEQLKRNLKWD